MAKIEDNKQSQRNVKIPKRERREEVGGGSGARQGGEGESLSPQKIFWGREELGSHNDPPFPPLSHPKKRLSKPTQ
jgi:hypothetical protein